LSLLLAFIFFMLQQNLPAASFEWSKLPPLPDQFGFAGAFAGVSSNALIVAGGANFPDAMPWDSGRKLWHDGVFILDRTNGVWRNSFKLPRALGYGVSITTPDGVLCAGGSDAKQHHRDVFLLRWNGRSLETKSLPPLPRPLANACGAFVGKTVFVAGGMETPDATNTLKIFWSLDISQTNANWRESETWPGAARMLATAAAVGDSFYLVGGTEISPDANGKPVRTYLKDAYRFTPGEGWARLADLPNPVVAAPSPAPNISATQFLIIGGDDGSLVNFAPLSQHPGFPKRALAYNVEKNAWSVVAAPPVSRATLPVVAWGGQFVLPSGEARPGVRSPEVWALKIGDEK
jgi:N-acetylneuraminate epimerase